jgi:hypothetical protein
MCDYLTWGFMEGPLVNKNTYVRIFTITDTVETTRYLTGFNSWKPEIPKVTDFFGPSRQNHVHRLPLNHEICVLYLEEIIKPRDHHITWFQIQQLDLVIFKNCAVLHQGQKIIQSAWC